MKWYEILLFTLLFSTLTLSGNLISANCNKNITTYLDYSTFLKKEKLKKYKSRSVQLNYGSVRVNLMKIFEPLVDEIHDRTTKRGRKVKQKDSDGVGLEFKDRARKDGFNVSKAEEHPYSVMLQMYSGEKSIGTCSGSLLSASWVLTAAHCVSKPPLPQQVSYVQVYAGGRGKEDPADISQSLRSLHIYRHPRHSDRLGYDVALIRLDGNFSLTASVNVIKLSSKPWSHRGYVTCEVTAFGAVQYGHSSPQDSTRKTHRLRVKKPCYCSYRLRMLMGRRPASKIICTEPKEDYGLCFGDSGSGLVCDGEVRALATSMVQMLNVDYCMFSLWPSKISCGSRNTLTIFLSTCAFLPWINSHVKLFNSTEISPACLKAGVTPTLRHTPLLMSLTSILPLVYNLH